jgi:signal transduction histidine kinase/CheY-like chemotaxis protein
VRNTILTVDIRYEHDVVLARQRARQISALIGFDVQDQTRISTSTSELARNVYQYVGRGKVEYLIETESNHSKLTITVSDRGPGIKEVDRILRGRYVSQTGMGLGILGAKRLMDEFSITTAPGEGTSITISKEIAQRAGRPPIQASKIAMELTRQSPQSPYEEMQQQNQELVRALDELKKRQEELAHLNRELEDTNRGVVALYAELDERADYLQRANEIKTSFLSNMTHEFRTPLNAIQSLTNLLLDRSDGDLTPEQEKQVTFIRRSAEDLTELVNDLLDLAKVEAGKISLRAEEFQIDSLFGALRGMLRPMLAYNNSVTLVFEEAETLSPMHSDERRISQVLRNLISNALKFTPKGEVRVRAEQLPDEQVLFTVSDTGIGIAPADQERIFQEWVQLENNIQKQVKGTGLGLPLSRRLAQLLGGTLTVESTPGIGSTFKFVIPRAYVGPEEASEDFQATPLAVGEIPILVLEDNSEAQFVYKKFLQGTRYQAIPARGFTEAREILKKYKPPIVIMDVLLGTDDSWPLLQELRTNPETHDLPVLMLSVQENERRARAMGATEFALKPVDKTWLLRTLDSLVMQATEPSVLIVDDDEISRYLLRNIVAENAVRIKEAPNGHEGLRLAGERHPSLIFLDLVMPDLSGIEVLERLRSIPTLRDIPVVVHTSKVLTEDEINELTPKVLDIIPKSMSRDAIADRVNEAFVKAGVVKGRSKLEL